VKVDGSKVRIALAGMIIGVLLGAYIGFSASPSSTLMIMGGVYPGAPSYTIWNEGSNYFAKNSNGEIEFSGTNATQVIINAIHENTKVFIKAGTYTIDSTIVKAVDNVIIEGEGNATIIKVKDNTAINAFNITNVSGWTIRNLQIDGNKAHQTPQKNHEIQCGIFVGDHAGTSVVNGVTLENLYIHDTAGNGIRVRSHNASHITIKNNYVWNTFADGISGGLCHDAVIANNHVWNCGRVIDADNKWHSINWYGREVTITGNIVLDSGGDGIEVYDIWNGTITGNVIQRTQRFGIYVQVASLHDVNVVVDGNVILDAGLNSSLPWGAWQDGIRVIPPNTVVSDNLIVNAGANGIYAATYANHTAITSNTIINPTTGGITVSQCSFVTVSGNTIRINNTSSTGIGLSNSHYCSVSGNVIFAGSAGSQRGINTDTCSYITITGNTIYGGSYGYIDWGGNSDYVTLVNTNAYDATVGIYPNQAEASSTIRIYACYNGTSWISSWGTG